VRSVNAQDARRNGVGFHGLIDGREDDFVAGDMNDDAASGEIGDDFVTALALLGPRDLSEDGTTEEEKTQPDRKN
jgi:hypothetical protein